MILGPRQKKVLEILADGEWHSVKDLADALNTSSSGFGNAMRGIRGQLIVTSHSIRGFGDSRVYYHITEDGHAALRESMRTVNS